MRCFFSRVVQDRAGMTDDPLMFALELTKTDNRRTYKYIEQLLMPVDYIGDALTVLRNRILNSDRTKFITYSAIKPGFLVHPVYSKAAVIKPFIPEHCRIAFSRLRLSSHRLRVETGRWARLPRDQRLWPCGAVQDEGHVLQDCPLVNHIRCRYSQVVIFPDILQNAANCADFKLIYDILSHFA